MCAPTHEIVCVFRSARLNSPRISTTFISDHRAAQETVQQCPIGDSV